MPEFVEVTPTHIAVGCELAATLVIVGYPREVFPGWLEPLTTYPARVDVSLHIDPVDPVVASAGLRRQLARLESDRATTAEHHRLPNPHVDAATADAYELAGRVARSETRLFRVGIALLVRAGNLGELREQMAALRSLASSMLLDARPAPYRALQGWTTALPLGVDSLGQRRAMDTACLAAAFPFSSPDLPGDPVTGAAPTGVLYGRNISSGGLVFYDRFTQPNYNSVVLAASGAGKSYLTKLELLRSLYRGVHAVVIDPEDEYTRLAHAVGGTHIRLGDPGVHINPLDLPLPTTTHHAASSPGAGGVGAGGVGAGRVGWGRDVLTRRSLYLHTVLSVLLGEPLTPTQRALADRGIHSCYAQAGITQNPATWTRPAPLLGDLAAAFSDLDDTTGTARELAARLAPFTSGSFSTLFSGPTTTPPEGHLVVFCLQNLPEELKPIGTLLALDATWRTVTHPPERRPRLVVVDEAWLLMAHPAGAHFLLRLAKSARKHWTGLTLVTQDAGDLLSSDMGRAVVSNAATQILLRTATQAAEQITTAFGLTDGERAFLTSAEVGSGLLLGSRARARVAFHTQASPEEDELITTDPAQLAALATPDDPRPRRRTSPDTGPGPLLRSHPTADDEDPL
ncbi:MAG: ATP-binding protein [Actinomycetota bacterium]|nr:ATP-binding protein [Actinomycetota bacterium]